MKKFVISASIVIVAGSILFSFEFSKKRHTYLKDEGQNPVPISTFIDQDTVKFVVKNEISILPETIFPGDPIFVTIDSSSTPVKILYDKKLIPIFPYNGKWHAIVGVDFYEKNLLHNIDVTFSDGSTTTKKISVTPREVVERPLSIPAKLGGDTKAAETALLTNLSTENAVLNNIKSTSTTLWSKGFGNPLAMMKITDDYGYNRKTVGSIIVHKGTDFRAAEGTAVMAMNDGVVKIAKKFTIYGNSVIVDHGLGVQTLYMHLSKIDVKEGEVVRKGDIIGLSGQTGYAEQPHLHISVKIAGVSIDPITFMGFFRKE